MERIICLVMGYAFGLFQAGYLYGKYRGVGIRQHGSGNPRSTNALRVVGVRVGLIVLLRDFFKTVIPYSLVGILFGSQPDYLYAWVLYAEFGVVLRHNLPFYLNFKDGKGTTATARVVTSLDWKLMLLCLAAFVLVMAVARYVSLGSLIVSTILVVWDVVMGQMGVYRLSAAAKPGSYGISAVIAAMAFWRHGANIVRPVQGEENKVGAKKR